MTTFKEAMSTLFKVYMYVFYLIYQIGARILAFVADHDALLGWVEGCIEGLTCSSPKRASSGAHPLWRLFFCAQSLSVWP